MAIENKRISMNISINVKLDPIDIFLVDFFKKYHNKSFRLSEIMPILEYEEVYSSTTVVANKLHDLSVLGFIQTEKKGKTNLYKIKS